MTSNSTVTARLRELRELAQVTLQDVAGVLGVSYASAWNIERGYAKLKDEQLEVLERFYAEKIDERYRRVLKSLEP